MRLSNRIILISAIIVSCIALAASCGRSHPSGSEAFEDGQNYKPQPSLSCSVSKEEGGSRIICPDGSSQFIPDGKTGAIGSQGEAGAAGAQGLPGSNGKAGSDGKDGQDGEDGYSIVFSTATAPIRACLHGGTTLLIGKDLNRNGVLDLNPMEPNSDGPIESINICNGINGVDGQDGKDGKDGAQGPKGDTGATGAQGPAGTPGVSTQVGFIDPCGDKAGIIDEVILKVSDDRGGWVLMASMSDNENGKNTRLSILTTGNYMTTDGSKCYFTVNSGVITRASYTPPND